MKFNYISDLHVDDWVHLSNNQIKNEKNIREFIHKLLINTKEKHDLLVLAGDVSNNNTVTLIALDELLKHFKFIIFVYGNHEYYLDTKNQKRKYGNSVKKVEELESLLPSNIKVLKNFEVFNYNGISFAGDTSWYSLETEEDKDFFYKISNDSKNISGIYIPSEHESVLIHYQNLNKVDVIVTHVPPIPMNGYGETHKGTACYLSPLPIEDKSSIWIFGHTHHRNFEFKINNTILLSNAIGYQEVPFKFKPTDNYKAFRKKVKDYKKKLESEICFLSYEIK